MVEEICGLLTGDVGCVRNLLCKICAGERGADGIRLGHDS